MTDDLRAQYQRDGVVFIKGAFGPDWVAKLQDGAEYNLKHPGPLCDEHVQPGQPGACEACGVPAWGAQCQGSQPCTCGFLHLSHTTAASPGPPGRFHDDQFLWRRHDTFKQFIFDSPAAAVRRWGPLAPLPELTTPTRNAAGSSGDGLQGHAHCV